MNARPSVAALHSEALEQLRRDDFAAAARTIRKMLILLPARHESRAPLLITLAFALLETGEAEEAHRVAQHAMLLEPQNVLARQQAERAERARKAS